MSVEQAERTTLRAALLVATAIVFASCGTLDDESAGDDTGFDDEAGSEFDDEPTDGGSAGGVGDASGDPEPLEDRAADELPRTDSPEPGDQGVRDDVDCSEDALGDFGDSRFTTAAHVVDGQLGDTCFGEFDQRLVDAWNALATITPQGQLTDLGLFGGFVAQEETEEVTLAFVNTLDADGSLFQMSINLDTSDEDPDEALLTMAHEFAHVFTSLPSQLDRSAEAAESCETYFNGEGCFAEDSLMFRWIDRFWDDETLAAVDPFGEATADNGKTLCDDDPGFYGPYAASNPEEDFAESFSAYVFDIENTDPAQQTRKDWMADRPGLVEFRERAVDAGLPTPTNNFPQCGLG